MEWQLEGWEKRGTHEHKHRGREDVLDPFFLFCLFFNFNISKAFRQTSVIRRLLEDFHFFLKEKVEAFKSLSMISEVHPLSFHHNHCQNN